MDRDHEQSTRPILAFEVIPWQAGLIKLRISNLGYGPALQISGYLGSESIAGKSTRIKWSYPVLKSEQYEEFGIPTPSAHGGWNSEHHLPKLKAEIRTVIADFSYQSPSEHIYSLNQTIELSSIANEWVESRMMATQDHPERLMPRVAKALDKIADKL